MSYKLVVTSFTPDCSVPRIYTHKDTSSMLYADIYDVLVGVFFFFQAEDGIRDYKVTGVQTCALPISPYIGMIASSATAWGDSRPQAFDKAHPATGDCNGCHTTSPTFATNQSGSAAKIGRASCRERV